MPPKPKNKTKAAAAKKKAAKKKAPAENPAATLTPKSKATPAITEYLFKHSQEVAFKKTSHKAELKVKIYGTPRPQYRTWGRSASDPNKFWVYNTSHENKDNLQKALLAALACLKARQATFDMNDKDPIAINLNFYFARPQAHYVYCYKTKQKFFRDDAPVYVTKTPDIDNLVKLVLDALQTIVYTTDNIVSKITAQKLWLNTKPHHLYSLTHHDGECMIMKVTQYKENTSKMGCDCMICKSSMK